MTGSVSAEAPPSGSLGRLETRGLSLPRLLAHSLTPWNRVKHLDMVNEDKVKR